MRMIGPKFDEKSPILDMLEVTFDFDSDTILVGYARYAEHIERLYRHHWKVKNLFLPACVEVKSL